MGSQFGICSSAEAGGDVVKVVPEPYHVGSLNLLQLAFWLSVQSG